MKPTLIRSILGKRRAWLIAKIEASVGKPVSYLTNECEALAVVLAMLAPFAPEPTLYGPELAVSPEERIQRAKEQFAKRQKVCTCGTCPVHARSAEDTIAP